jgi:hypothetical protein
VSELAFVFMDAEIEELCRDRQVEHKVAVEESGGTPGGVRVSQIYAKTRRDRMIVDALYAFQSLVPTWHTLRDATVVDNVGCLVSGTMVVHTRHPERLLGTRGRGSQEEQVSFISKAMILILIRLKSGRRSLIAQRRWRRDVEVQRTVRRARRITDMLLLIGKPWQWGRWGQHVRRRIRGCGV